MIGRSQFAGRNRPSKDPARSCFRTMHLEATSVRNSSSAGRTWSAQSPEGARVHDAATADAMLGAVLEFGHDQLDTCSVYGDGTCEQMLGDLRAAERFGIATRIHSGSPPGSAALNT